jgi:ketosteroid isomerase-like protein
LTQEEIRNLAEEWISAWNAQDLDAIMSHYHEAVELTSPVAAQLLGIPGGKVSGKANVSAYFHEDVERPDHKHF